MGGGGSALRVCADHRGGINWLSLSPDGQRLLTGSEDGTARLWSTADGTCCALLQGRPARPRPPTARYALPSASRQPLTCPQTASPKSSAHPPWTLVEEHPRGGGRVGVQRGRDLRQRGKGRGGEGAVSGQQLGETTSITAVVTNGKKTAPLPLELSVALPSLSLAL